MFENAAEAFSNYIRANSHENFSEPARGTILHYATCVQINWAWIALPAALAALTIALLVMSVMSTAKHQAPIWKSHPLALIFHSLNGVDWHSEYKVDLSKIKKKYSSLNKIKTIEALADKISVRLNKEEPLIWLLKVNVENRSKVEVRDYRSKRDV